MTARERIIGMFAEFKELSIKEIVDKIGISNQMAHLVVARLVSEGRVEKLGRPPKTIYRWLEEKQVQSGIPNLEISQEDAEMLERNFLVITETGTMLVGIKAFDHWCRQRKLPLLKTLQEYKLTKKKYQTYYREDGLIDGMEKLKNTKGYDHIWLDELYYLDFYAIERFGKTRLGTLLHYAKQGQNKFLMSIMLKEISPVINHFVKLHRADAICFVPPTIRREVQLMKFLQTNLNIPLPIITIKKVSGLIPVPQKSLSKLEERINNADKTFAVTEQSRFRKMVLIDDAVGSGSTLNQLAAKLKAKSVAEEVIGLAIVGSFKGFDVITDV